MLLKAGIAISMDGKGSWRDNVFVERLWRSIKYEERGGWVCLNSSVREDKWSAAGFRLLRIATAG
jgi:transposase InsO family protein